MERNSLISYGIKVFLISFLLSCEICKFPFDFLPERDPDLIFLVGDTLGHKFYCTNPVVSPDGKTVYYLRAPMDSAFPESDASPIGSVYAIDMDRKNDRKILPGKYDALAISPDGNKIAVHPFKGTWWSLKPESLILIFHLNTQKIDSYKVMGKKIGDIEFSYDNQFVFYQVGPYWDSYSNWYSEIYKLNLADSTNEKIGEFLHMNGMDLFKDGRIYRDSLLVLPQINPLNEKYVIGGLKDWFNEIVMREISTNKLIYFEKPAFQPWWLIEGWVGQPYWFPDGNSIVFSFLYCGCGGCGFSSIWILKNVFKHIKD